MKKQLTSLKRLSLSLLLGGALISGITACSTGTSEGQVNVEESDFKDKSPTEHNTEGLSDPTQDQLNNTGQDSSNQDIYEQQENKIRERNSGTSNQGFGGAAERSSDKKNQ